MNMRQIFIFIFLLSLSMTSTCYNGGSEYLQVFRSSNVEIKTLLQDVVIQLKKQNKKSEKMLKHLESQTDKVGEVFQHLKGQNDHLGELLRNLDSQDKHMDLVLKKIRRINETDYNEQIEKEFNRNLHFGMIDPGKRPGISDTLVRYRDLDDDIEDAIQSFKNRNNNYDHGGLGRRKNYYDFKKSGYSPLHALTNYGREDKIFDFSENRKKSHEDFLSFISNNTRSMTVDGVSKGPLILVPHKLIGALLGTDIQIECFVQHHAPTTRTYWRFNGTAIPMAHLKYKNNLGQDEEAMERMTLVVLDLSEKDNGTYDCVAEDDGKVDFGTIMVYILRTFG